MEKARKVDWSKPWMRIWALHCEKFKTIRMHEQGADIIILMF